MAIEVNYIESILSTPALAFINSFGENSTLGRRRCSVPFLVPVIADWPGSNKAPKPGYQTNLNTHKTQPASARADAS